MKHAKQVDPSVAIGATADALTHKARDAARRRLLVRSYFSSLSLYALTLLVVATLVFVLPRAMPGDPLASLDDPDNSAYISDPALRTRVLAYYGLDQPLPSQYRNYLINLGRGELGWSIARNAPVGALIVSHLGWTLALMFSALALAAAISFVAGLEAAWRRGQGIDRWVVIVMTALRAAPEFAIAALLLIAFAVLLPIFPLSGARTPFVSHTSTVSAIADLAYHIMLPAAALTLSLLGSKVLLVRNTVISSLGEDYLLLARAKGLPERLLKYRHAGRNSLLPFLTVVALQTGFATGGALFVEAVFAYPGMGTLIMKAVEARDYPVLEASFLVLALIVIAANLLVDCLYRLLDPRTEAA